MLAAVLDDSGNPDEAVDRAEHALSIYTSAYGHDHRVTRSTRAFLDDLRSH